MKGRRRQPARDCARRWLACILQDGPVVVDALRYQAHQQRLAWRTVQRAGAGIVLARRIGYHPGHWVWTLDATPEDEESRPIRKCPTCGAGIGDV